MPARRPMILIALLMLVGAWSHAPGVARAADAPLTLALTPSRIPPPSRRRGTSSRGRSRACPACPSGPGCVGLRGSGGGAQEPPRGSGVRPSGRLRARQPRGRVPDHRARCLAGQDGVHRAVLRQEGHRDRAGRGSPRQDGGLRRPCVELGLHLPDGAPDQEGAGARPRPEDVLQGGAVLGHARGRAPGRAAWSGRRGGLLRQVARGST